jgi:TRIAD3 protein (E3 ubiquitin-protein ligase RNF216)
MDMSGCQSFFSRDQLSKSLSAKVMKKYDELQTTLVLEKAGLNDICKCPKCDFQASLAESEKVFQCPSCAYESCRMCGEESHIPLRCEEVEKKTETSARLQIEEAMTQARIRHCPNGCKQGFYKVEGCNKMTCPTCKTFICYVCRAEIKKVRKMYYIMNVRMNLMLNTFGNNIPAECWLCPFLPNPALPAQTV